jgi:hypothetical protein
MAFSPISAGIMDNGCCLICHAQSGKPSVLPKGVRLVCDCCLDKVPQSLMQEKEPEHELFCPACGMETVIVGADAIMYEPNPKHVDYVIGPYTAVCHRCFAFLRTIHPDPEAALNYWRDHPEAGARSR